LPLGSQARSTDPEHCVDLIVQFALQK